MQNSLTTKTPRHQEFTHHIRDLGTLDALGKEIVHCAFTIHKEMGPGLLESIYEECFAIALSNRNISFETQKSIPLSFEGSALQNKYRLDLLVEDSIIIELKCVERLIPLHQAQILSYLKLTNKKLGYLINFNVPLIKDGIKRIAN